MGTVTLKIPCVRGVVVMKMNEQTNIFNFGEATYTDTQKVGILLDSTLPKLYRTFENTKKYGLSLCHSHMDITHLLPRTLLPQMMIPTDPDSD